MRVINLDPAAEAFKYDVAAGVCRRLAVTASLPDHQNRVADIRELISVDDVMEECKYGPNGALVYCMDYLCRSMEWMDEVLDPYGEDDYILFDCPGQIELYSHVPVMLDVVRKLQAEAFNVVGVYLVDAMLVTDASKLMAGALMALSAMVNIEIPHVNVMSKCDLVPAKQVEKYVAARDCALATSAV